MNASLIGKALVFGPNEYRFESYAFNLSSLKSSVYLQNQLNFALIQNKRYSRLRFSKNILILIKVFLEVGYIYKFFVLNKNWKNLNIKEILLTIFFYKQTPFFKSCKLISTSAKSFFITLKALQLLKNNLEQSILILSTSKGIITHKKALQLNIGGLLLYIIR